MSGTQPHARPYTKHITYFVRFCLHDKDIVTLYIKKLSLERENDFLRSQNQHSNSSLSTTAWVLNMM